MPEQRFWRMLEELSGQIAPLAVWRNYLGDWPLFDQIRRKYLLATGQRATSLECPTPCPYVCPRRVIEYAPGDIEVICPEQEAPPIKIADKDLLFYGLKQSAIMKAVSDAIGIAHKPSEPAGCHSSWRIGDFIPPRGDSAPVYVSMQEGLDDLDRVVKTLCLLHSDSIVLLTPTRRRLSAESEQILRQHNSVFISMEEELLFTEKANLQTSSPKDFLFRKLLPVELRTTPADPLPQNIFRQCGSRWQMRFQGGEPVYLNRQKGIEYITALLAAPYQSISVLDLYDNGTMDEQTRAAMKAGGFKVSEYRQVEKLRENIKDIEREIAEAEDYHDHERAERLREEKEQILKQVNGMIGPGGKLRKSDDPLKKPRDAASKAIRRAIKNIREDEMDRFADHLEKCIVFGNEMMYNPRNDIHWETLSVNE